MENYSQQQEKYIIDSQNNIPNTEQELTELEKVLLETLNNLEKADGYMMEMKQLIPQKQNIKLNEKISFLNEFQLTVQDLITKSKFLLKVVQQKQLDEEEQANLEQNYKNMPKSFLTINNQEQICVYTTKLLIHTINSNQLLKTNEICTNIVLKLKQQNLAQKEIEKLFMEIQFYKYILAEMARVFEYAVLTDKNDLFGTQNSKELQKVYQSVIEFKNFGDKATIQQKFNKLSQDFLLFFCAVAKINFTQPKKVTLPKVICNLCSFKCKKNLKVQARYYQTQQTVHNGFDIFNLASNNTLHKLNSMNFQKIKFNQFIYINRFLNPLTLEGINKEIEANMQNEIEMKSIGFLDEEIIKRQNVIQQIVDRDILMEAPHKIQIKLLCYQHIDCQFNPKKKKSTGCCSGSYNQKQKLAPQIKESIVNKYKDNEMEQQLEVVEDSESLNFEAILIHIHGGGFSAEDTKTHECYTRIWANQLKIPVFSLEYRKSPEHPYPGAFDDVRQCYYWIINYADKFLKIRFKKVILAGDSAGGNLVAALTIWIIKEGLRMPDGILLIYPALRMVEEQFSPSILKSIEDLLLSLAGMKLILKAYVPKNAQPSDIYLSPILASDQILSRFPPTRMILGQEDPIYDDCVRFAARLLQLGKDVKAICYNNVPHGFIQFVDPIKECAMSVTDSMNMISQMIKDSN